MKDDLSPEIAPNDEGVSDPVKAASLFALGSFYVRQGFPKQGLALLLAAESYGERDPALIRAIARAYLLAGVPRKTLDILERVEPQLEDPKLIEGATLLRARALLALGHVDEAHRVKRSGAGLVALQTARTRRRA